MLAIALAASGVGSALTSNVSPSQAYEASAGLHAIVFVPLPGSQSGKSLSSAPDDSSNTGE